MVSTIYKIFENATKTAIYSFYSHIDNFIERGECPIGLFLNECVEHNMLLKKNSR